MFSVGLTGNVAAGKSSVAQHFAAWGATLIDADELVREVQRPGSSILAAIRRRFGPSVLLPDGALDRDRLRRMMLDDDGARDALGAIVHPAVQHRRAQLQDAAAARGDCIVVHDIPLLFEVLDPDAFDLVVLVDAPVEVRRTRLVARGLLEDEATRLIRAQWPSAAKRHRSDVVIDNADTVEDLEQRAWEAWCAIRTRAATVGSVRPLLAVTAHPGDEASILGGTLARYADAGIATHLVCVTGDGAAPEARQHLETAVELLGVAQLTALAFAPGGVSLEDRAGIDAVVDALRRIEPDVTITFDHDATGDPDHAAVHHWTRLACEQVGCADALFYATAARATTDPDASVTVRLDVRPWQDVKRAAINTYQSAPVPRPTPTAAAPALDRESYRSERPRAGVASDLYAALETG